MSLRQKFCQMITHLHWQQNTEPCETPKPGELHLWLIPLLEADMDLSERLSTDEQKRLAALHHESDKQRFTTARVSMRAILSGYLNVHPDTLCFSYGVKGKPLLSSPTSGIQFNISHTNDLALLAVSRDIPLGIDLEMLKQRPNARRIAQRIFDPQIHRRLMQLGDKDFMTAFLLYWTQHEARVKAIGEGVFSENAQQAMIECKSFTPRQGWIASIAAEGRLPDPKKWLCQYYTPLLE